MTELIKVGLVGCGGMGKAHLRHIRDELAGYQVVALCDVQAAAIEETRKEYGVEAAYEDFERMYEAEDLDLVVVATQTRGHCAPTVAALARGIPVLCEKPIAIDLVEADEMVTAADRSGARLAINQQNHVSPQIREAQAQAQRGTIGEPVLIRGRNKCGRKSGNEFMEMGTHVTDMMLCFGDAVEWCAGTIYNEGRPAAIEDIMEAKQMSPKDRDSGLVMGDRAVGHFGFSGGVLGEIHFLGHAQTYSPNYGVDIVGTTGLLAVRSSGSGELWHLPRPQEGSPGDFGDWRPIELPAGEMSATARMYLELMQAHTEGVEPSASGAKGREAFEMVLGLYQSHREGGRRVELPLAPRRHPLEVWREQGD